MSNDRAPWFRMFSDRWKADTRGLNQQEKGIYADLLMEMHEREAPLSDAWLEQVRSITRARPKTFFAAIEKLIALGLVVRTDDGLWSHFMESEIANRRGRSEKARRSANKSRQNPDQNPDFQPEKSEQNQRSGPAIEIQTEIKREAPKGASSHTNSFQNKNCSGGSASERASPDPAERKDCPSSDDIPPSMADIETVALGALEAPRATFDGATIPPPVDDPCRGWVPEYAPAGSEDYADANALAATASARPMLDDEEEFEVDEDGREYRIGRDDGCGRHFEPDDGDATEIDEHGRERPIRDSADEEWLSGWPDDAETENAMEKELAE